MKLLYYAKRALSLPPQVVFQKIIHKLKREFRQKKKKFLDQKFPTYAPDCPFSQVKRFIHRLDLSSLPKEKINSACQHYLKHEFDLLGSGWVSSLAPSEASVNPPNRTESKRLERLIQEPYSRIDWQLDFKSGYRWSENTWSPEIRYGMESGVDVKVPWELSRMQHLVHLAWNYGLKKESVYLKEFRNQVIDFIAANPPRFGVNWSCTMDVGIRIANWLLAYDLFRCFEAEFDAEFESAFVKSVYEHGLHIFTHLEWDPYLRSNHYLANIAGLLFVAAYLDAKEWLSFSLKELEAEGLSQFHPDGSNFEASTSYHRLSAEMVLYATALAKEINHPFSKEYEERIEKMAEFIHDITKPDGEIVQFGDNDSGRFIQALPEENVLDHRYLIRAFEGKNLSEVIEKQFKKAQVVPKPMAAYPDFGLYMQKKGPWFLAFRCGSIGQKGNGGHAHNDQLSFELALNGVSIVVDPGTYAYTPWPEERRRFRSSSMHNTLSLEGKEQNRDGGLFQLTDQAKGRVIQFEEGLIVAEHQGFGPIHRRTVKMGEECIEGIDECDAEGLKKIFFHLAPGQKAEVWADQGDWKREESLYSRAYGKKEATSVLVLYTYAKRTAWKIFSNPLPIM